MSQRIGPPLKSPTVTSFNSPSVSRLRWCHRRRRAESESRPETPPRRSGFGWSDCTFHCWYRLTEIAIEKSNYSIPQIGNTITEHGIASWRHYALDAFDICVRRVQRQCAVEDRSLKIRQIILMGSGVSGDAASPARDPVTDLPPHSVSCLLLSWRKSVHLHRQPFSTNSHVNRIGHIRWCVSQHFNWWLILTQKDELSHLRNAIVTRRTFDRRYWICIRTFYQPQAS